MEVLNPIYMAPNMTALTKMTKNKNFKYLFCIVWRSVTVLIECFHLQNETLVNGVQDMSQKIINRESYKICKKLPFLSSSQK